VGDEGIGVPFELPDRAGHSTLRYATALDFAVGGVFMEGVNWGSENFIKK
jgi:hypothetical protein